MVKKKQFLIVIYALILAIIIAGVAVTVIFMERKQINSIKADAAKLQTELNTNRQYVYVALQDIPAGEELKDQYNVSMQEIYSGMDSSVYMTADQLGYKALVPIKAGAPVQSSMLGEQDITKDTRYYEVNVVNISTRQKDHDVVDIRIVFPDGSDYVLLAKKEIMNLSGTVFDLFLNEDEILRLTSAMVDAANNGARMYTTKYVETQLQDEAVPFYPVKQTTIDLINSDPNIVRMAQETLNSAVRQNLEDRLINMKNSMGEGESKQLSANFKNNIEVDQAKSSATTETLAEDEEDASIDIAQ